MNWQRALQVEVLGDAAATQLDRYFRRAMPRFSAPTDATAWRREIPKLRRRALQQVYLRGYPKTLLESPPAVVWGDVLQPHPAYRIRKLRFEAYPQYWIPALLYEPTMATGPLPVVLNPNGHHRGGKAVLYKQARCINLAKRGMLAMNFEFPGMGELEADCRHDDLAFLDLSGLAGVGLMYLAMKGALDVLLAEPAADATRVAMTGLSGGGWQTIVLSAMDPRITVSVPVAGYTAVRERVRCLADLGDLEQMPVNLLTVVDYDAMTAMLAPRPALLILNENDDCCFQTARARPIIYDAVRPTYRAMGCLANFETYNNTDPGTHNYEVDNRQQLYRFLARHFRLESAAVELPCTDELLTEAELNVGLPPAHRTVGELALARCREVVGGLRSPRTASQRLKLRRKLTEVLTVPPYSPRLKRVAGNAGCGAYTLTAGPFRVPLTIRLAARQRSVRLVLDPGGRGGLKMLPERHVSYVVPDLLGCGELRYDLRRLAVIDCIGERLLGIRVAQVLACAAAGRRLSGVDRLSLWTVGINEGLAGLLAAALAPELFSELTLWGGFPQSLVRLLEWGVRYDACQGALCFGLLQVADVPQLLALLDGVAVHQPGRCVPSFAGGR